MSKSFKLINSINENLSSKKLVAEQCMFSKGDTVQNVDPSCEHYMSRGVVESIEGNDTMPEQQGYTVAYKTTNSGKTWSKGEILKKHQNQLAVATDFSNDDSKNTEYNSLPVFSEEMSPDEYKKDFYEMSIASITAIMHHAHSILENLDKPRIKENLTEPWLQGKIAITEDYMRTIHDFVMFISEAADNVSVADKPGLWENIRKKKEREGKNYKPAKPGDKDRPDPDQWKKLTK